MADETVVSAEQIEMHILSRPCIETLVALDSYDSHTGIGDPNMIGVKYYILGFNSAIYPIWQTSYNETKGNLREYCSHNSASSLETALEELSEGHMDDFATDLCYEALEADHDSQEREYRDY